MIRWKYNRYVEDHLRCIASVDDGIGRMLGYLKEAGLEKDTIVIYCSDQSFYLVYSLSDSTKQNYFSIFNIVMTRNDFNLVL